MSLETFKLWGPLIVSGMVGLVTLGAIPKCGDFQTREQAQIEHTKIESRISAVKDSLTDTKLEVIKEIHQLKEDILRAIPHERDRDRVRESREGRGR